MFDCAEFAESTISRNKGVSCAKVRGVSNFDNVFSCTRHLQSTHAGDLLVCTCELYVAQRKRLCNKRPPIGRSYDKSDNHDM